MPWGVVVEQSYEFDGFTLKVTGAGDAVSRFEDFIGFYPADGAADPDFSIRLEPIEGAPETLLGDGSDGYGRYDEQFFTTKNWATLSIEKSWDEARFDPHRYGCGRAGYVLTNLLRHRHANEGLAVLKASAVEYEGEVIAFPAWRDSGKTSVLISLLLDGANYLSDDVLWIDGDGRATSYDTAPMLQTISTRLLAANGNGPHSSRAVRARDRFANALESLRDRLGPGTGRVVEFAEKRYVRPGRRVPLSESVPDAEFVPAADVDRLVFLERAGADVIDTPQSESITPDAARQFLETIRYHRLDKELYEMYRSYDLLFPETPSRTDELESVVAAEDEVYDDVVDAVDVHKMRIPTTTDWDRSFRDAILEAVQA